LLALAIGRDIWRGRQSDSEASWRGELRVVASVGVGLAQATSGRNRSRVEQHEIKGFLQSRGPF
jgi:hypothetical protein